AVCGVCQADAAGVLGGPGAAALLCLVPSGLAAAREQAPAVGADARLVLYLCLAVHAPAVRSPLVWCQEVEPPRSDGFLVISLHVCCDRVPSPPGAPIMGAMAPPGRDAAACNTPTSPITSKKARQKTALTGSTPSPRYPLPWLPRGHKSSAGTT